MLEGAPQFYAGRRAAILSAAPTRARAFRYTL
jgi:hypothetical protein